MEQPNALACSCFCNVFETARFVLNGRFNLHVIEVEGAKRFLFSFVVSLNDALFTIVLRSYTSYAVTLPIPPTHACSLLHKIRGAYPLA